MPESASHRRAVPAPRGRAAKHNPGGRIRSALPQDVRHRAVFSFCGHYRPLLKCWKVQPNGRFPSRFIAFIGMNPSTADGAASDPTVSRGRNMALRMGYHGMVQLNVADIRGTQPATLPTLNMPLSSNINIRFILKFAKSAEKVFACWGELTDEFAEAAYLVFDTLRRELPDKPIYCFGTTQKGWPRHFRGLPQSARCEILTELPRATPAAS